MNFLLSLLRWQCYIWLPGYITNRFSHKREIVPKAKDIHVIFLFVDHFEPSRKEGASGVKKVQDWCEKYHEIVKLHRDSDGISLQHTWFYRYDYPCYECIKILSEYVYKRFGEIEFHFHHGYDTRESFTEKICGGVAWFNQVGAMISAEDKPQMHFGYIAGNWALDNGRRNPALSGVNRELSALRSAGCYADFTFPAFGTNAQPRKVNSIYYAKDTPSPKSYNTGVDVRVGGTPSGDLMLFQGPLYVDWARKYTETAALESFVPYQPERIEYCMRAGIHVIGRPEWIFIKLHTHGIQSRDVVLGNQLNTMLCDLEKRFKAPPYRLHYVTAREAYNIVKAAEAGKQGDPNNFRDFSIPQPANRKMYCDQPYRLEKYSKDHVIIKIESLSNNTVILFKDLPVLSIKGDEIKRVEMVYSVDSIESLQIDGNGRCTVSYKEFQNGKHINKLQTFNMPIGTSEKFKKSTTNY